MDRDRIRAHPSRRELLTDEEWADVVATVGGERSIVLLQDDLHDRLHREIARRLTRSMSRYREERVRTAIHRYLDAFVAAGGGNFSVEVAEPVPPTIICSVLGLDWQDEGFVRLVKQLDDVVGGSRRDVVGNLGVPQVIESARDASEQLNAILEPAVRARRDRPEDDFISQLWEFAPEILPDCDVIDIVAQCRQVIAGGSQSSDHLLSNAAAVLSTDRELWTRLNEDPRLVDRFVEELLRVVSVLRERPRIARRDVELAGHQVRAGDHVWIAHPAVNHDPRQYPTPLRIDLDGPPQRHLAFHAGGRTCPGAGFGRAEAREVIRSLLALVDRLSPDPEKEPPSWSPSPTGILGSWRPVHVRFE